MGEGQKTLVQIVSDMQALDELLTESGGEISDEQVEIIVNQWIAESKKDLALKLDGYQIYMEGLEASEASNKAWAAKANQIAKSKKKLRENLESRLIETMIAMGKNEVTGNKFKFKVKQGRYSTKILDDSKVPAEYCRSKITIEVDKNAIKEAFQKTGVQIDGTSVEKPFVLEVKPNTKE